MWKMIGHSNDPIITMNIKSICRHHCLKLNCPSIIICKNKRIIQIFSRSNPSHMQFRELFLVNKLHGDGVVVAFHIVYYSLCTIINMSVIIFNIYIICFTCWVHVCNTKCTIIAHSMGVEIGHDGRTKCTLFASHCTRDQHGKHCQQLHIGMFNYQPIYAHIMGLFCTGMHYNRSRCFGGVSSYLYNIR